MPVATTTDKRGLKRICLNCSTRFYDFNKRPIICPNCSTEFTGDVKIKTRRSRVANDDHDGPISKIAADEVVIESIKDVEDDEEEAETVSLEDVEEDEAEDDADEETDGDLDLDDDLDDDDDDDDDDEFEDEEEEDGK